MEKLSQLTNFCLGCIILVISFSCSNDVGISLQAAARDKLSVLDINVWSGLNYQGNLWMGEYEPKAVREKRYQALLHQIKQLDPDIIGVHEANKLPDYAERLASNLGYDVFFHVGVGGVRLGPVGLPWNLREGDAILTKKDLQAESAGRLQLSGGHVGNFFTFHFSDATQVIAVKITNRSKPLYIFATHWHASVLETPEIISRSNELRESGRVTEEEYKRVLAKTKESVDWRMSESQKTVAFIQKTAGDHPFILMGDFNAVPGSREIDNLLEFGMIDAFRVANPDSAGFTWDPRSNLNHKKYYLNESQTQNDKLDLYSVLKQIHEAAPKRIDFIFLGPSSALKSQGISVRSSRVVLDEVISGVHASDHYGVFSEIEFANGP